LLLTLCGSVFAQPLDQQVKDAIAGFQGTVFLYAKNLDTGKTYGIRENERVRTASTIKLPIMVAVFQAVANGEAKWDENLTLRDKDKVSGSGVLTEFSDGVKLPIRDVMHLMIVVSNDLAVPSGWSAAGKLPENQKYGLGSSTPREMVTLLEMIDRGEVVSKDASKEMIAVLKRNRDLDCIRRHFGDIPVANKTGALDALRSDVGIVYSPKGKVAMAITCDGMPVIDYSPDNKGAILIAKLAEILVNGLSASQ
jgi:beta-lactamase class A